MNKDTLTLDLSNKPDAGLYIVATPIGNLRDITLRALDILHNADIILCEDTRVTRKLTNAYSISTKLIAYHDHNAEQMRPFVLDMLQKDKVIALVSDAGTPLISDPGYKLVRDCAEQNASIYPIPGASAVLSALVVAGLPTDNFLFFGFLPPKTNARKNSLLELKPIKATLVFYESAKRLKSCLNDMLKTLGNRPAVVAREITKKFEQVKRGSLEGLNDYYAENGAPKGEIVIIIGPQDANSPDQALSQDDIDDRITTAINDLNMSIKDASSYVANELGIKKRDIYARAIILSSNAHKNDGT